MRTVLTVALLCVLGARGHTDGILPACNVGVWSACGGEVLDVHALGKNEWVQLRGIGFHDDEAWSVLHLPRKSVVLTGGFDGRIHVSWRVVLPR